MNETAKQFQLHVFLKEGGVGGGPEGRGRALLTHGDAHGTGQAPPRRTSADVGPAGQRGDEARLGAALLN